MEEVKPAGGVLFNVLFVAWAFWCGFIFFSHLKIFSDKFSVITSLLDKLF